MVQTKSGFVESRSGQSWSAQSCQDNVRFVSEYREGVVDRHSPRPGERILYLGRGDGALTASLVRAGAEVGGVDSAPDFVGAGKQPGLDDVVASLATSLKPPDGSWIADYARLRFEAHLAG